MTSVSNASSAKHARSPHEPPKIWRPRQGRTRVMPSRTSSRRENGRSGGERALAPKRATEIVCRGDGLLRARAGRRPTANQAETYSAQRRRTKILVRDSPHRAADPQIGFDRHTHARPSAYLLVGTAGYMSPEVRGTRSMPAPTFLFGLRLLEELTGGRPSRANPPQTFAPS